jgi:hypothetical protein
MVFKHQQTIDRYYQWRKRREELDSDSEVKQARSLKLSELREDVDTVVSKEFSELDSLL